MQFSVFDRSNTPELPDNSIINLYYDRSGRFWISTGTGLACVQNGHWTVFGKDDGWTGDYVRSFSESSQGALYLSSFNGVLARFKGGAFEMMDPPGGEGGGGYVTCVDSADRLWALNQKFGGLWLEGRWEAVRGTAFRAGGFGVGTARNGRVWGGDSDRVRKYNGRELVFEKKAPFPVSNVWALYEDLRGVLWISSFVGGLSQYLPDGTWRHLTSENGLADNSLRSVFEDREGNVWVGSSGGGLMRFKQRQQRALARERLRLAAVLESTGDLVAFADLHGTLLFMNPAGPFESRVERGIDRFKGSVRGTFAARGVGAG